MPKRKGVVLDLTPMNRRVEVDEGLGQMGAHEPVGARDEHSAAGVDVPELAPQLVEAVVAPDRVGKRGRHRGEG